MASPSPSPFPCATLSALPAFVGVMMPCSFNFSNICFAVGLLCMLARRFTSRARRLVSCFVLVACSCAAACASSFCRAYINICIHVTRELIQGAERPTIRGRETKETSLLLARFSASISFLCLRFGGLMRDLTLFSSASCLRLAKFSRPCSNSSKSRDHMSTGSVLCNSWRCVCVCVCVFV